MSKELKWFDLFEAFFGVKLTAIERETWESMLRKMGANGGEVCDVLREFSTRDSVPRADRSRATAKYDLRDLQLWIKIYRQSSAPQGVAAPANLRESKYVQGYCRLIDRLLQDGDRKAAALTADGNLSGSFQMDGSGYQYQNEIWIENRLSTRDPTPDELDIIRQHALSRDLEIYKEIAGEYEAGPKAVRDPLPVADEDEYDVPF